MLMLGCLVASGASLEQTWSEPVSGGPTVPPGWSGREATRSRAIGIPGSSDVPDARDRLTATAVSQSNQENPAAPTPESTPPAEQPPKELSPEEKAALAEGQALFRGLCSGCHGGLGRGGKGPDLTDNRWLHGDKDEDIKRVIQNGVPGTTMKKLGESLKEQQIAKIIAYVRSLARAPGDSNWKPYMPGDPKAGEQLFFDDKSKTPCSKCHTVNRKGGRVGPTLDRIAARRSPEFIMESIVTPSKFIDPLFEAVSVATRDGKVIVGLRINETNFSIQLREENGRFHSLMKRDLDEFRVMDKSLMPENMTVKQLHDLFAYLMTLE
jgi:putative heme-binding domain-containing protein